MLSPVRISSTGYRRPGQSPMRLDRQKFYNVHRYNLRCCPRCTLCWHLETIHNNDAAVINFTGSRVTVLTQFRSGSCTLETPWVIGVFSAGTPWAIFRPNPPGVLVNITIENNMVISLQLPGRSTLAMSNR